jgi:hypothetical protein
MSITNNDLRNEIFKFITKNDTIYASEIKSTIKPPSKLMPIVDEEPLEPEKTTMPESAVCSAEHEINEKLREELSAIQGEPADKEIPSKSDEFVALPLQKKVVEIPEITNEGSVFLENEELYKEFGSGMNFSKPYEMRICIYRKNKNLSNHFLEYLFENNSDEYDYPRFVLEMPAESYDHTEDVASPVPAPIQEQEPAPFQQPEPAEFTQPEPAEFTQPEPAPLPQPEPLPFPQQESAPLPEPEPVPLPETEPAPLPETEPVPLPETEPAPLPEQEPAPLPEQEPALFPEPEPVPLPEQEPAPLPETEPAPFSEPEHAPFPQPEPIPQPIGLPVSNSISSPYAESVLETNQIQNVENVEHNNPKYEIIGGSSDSPTNELFLNKIIEQYQSITGKDREQSILAYKGFVEAEDYQVCAIFELEEDVNIEESNSGAQPISETAMVSESVVKTSYVWITLDEIINKRTCLDKPIAKNAYQMFNKNPSLAFMHYTNGKPIPIPTTFYICENDNAGTYKNSFYTEEEKLLNTQSLIDPSVEHPTFGPVYLFSTRPIEQDNVVHIKRYAVNIEDTLNILNKNQPLNAFIKLEHKSDAEVEINANEEERNKTYEDYECICFYEGDIELWAVKNSFSFAEL